MSMVAYSALNTPMTSKLIELKLEWSRPFCVILVVELSFYKLKSFIAFIEKKTFPFNSFSPIFSLLKLFI